MKFTDGFWQLRPGVTALYSQEAFDIWETATAADGAGLVVTAPTYVIAKRGDVLNRPVLSVELSSPLEGVVRVRVSHHKGRPWHGGFDLPGAVSGAGEVSVGDDGGGGGDGEASAVGGGIRLPDVIRLLRIERCDAGSELPEPIGELHLLDRSCRDVTCECSLEDGEGR